MAERYRGQQGACDVIRELIGYGGWMNGLERDLMVFNDQIVMASLTENPSQPEVSKRLTSGMAMLALEEAPSLQSFSQIIKVYIDLIAIKWGGGAQQHFGTVTDVFNELYQKIKTLKSDSKTDAF